MVKLGLVGYGKMGQAIDSQASKHPVTVIGRALSQDQLSDLKQADVCIEFTKPDSALGNIQKLALWGKNLVVGTTGWMEHLGEVEKIVERAQIGMIYASNFSIGVYMMKKLCQTAGQLMRSFPDYEAMGLEIHHREKRDAPSGTALELSRLFSHESGRELPFSSMRLANHPGAHAILIEGADSLEIRHTSRSREAYADGALRAAQWIHGKKGLFTFEDMMEDLLLCKV